MDNTVSIVMPVYNSQKYLPECIESVINQTYSDWELIIVNDCSTDDSISVIESYCQIDTRIHLINLVKNAGAAICRNTGIHNATGKFLAFIDSDDLWSKNKLEIQINIMISNDYAFTFTSYDLVDKSNVALNKIVTVPPRIKYKTALYKTVIFTSTVMIDLNQIGIFDMPNLRAGQDVATWLMLLKKIPYAHGINTVLSSYRQVPTSISSSIKRRFKRMWDIYRKAEKLNIFFSTFLYMRYVCYVLQKRKKIRRIT